MHEDFGAPRKPFLTFLFLLTVNVFFLTANLTGYVRTIKNFIFYIISPTPFAASRLVITGQKFSDNVAELVNVHQENIRLKKTLEQYVNLDNECREARNENERLSRLVNFPVPKHTQSIPARVITRIPGDWFEWIVIDRGRQQGVFLNAPVFAWMDGQMAVIGRVGEVSGNSAKVVLLTSLLSSFPVTVKSLDEDGLLEGQNGPLLEINYLLPDTRITVGDEITTSPLSSVFPSGIIVGNVVDIKKMPNQKFSTVVVRPSADLNRLREVIVLAPVGSPAPTDSEGEE
jgi:rod shape-determining protein MreC